MSIRRLYDEWPAHLESRPERRLPPPDTRRWSARRKAEVVKAMRGGWLTVEKACRLYGLSEEELAAWERDFDRHGEDGLKLRHLRERRHARSPGGGRVSG